MLRWVSIAAAVLVPVLCFGAKGDWWLDVNLGSKHSEERYTWQGKTESFNETNFGLGTTYELATWCDVKAGWFDNSYHKNSVYALINPQWNVLRSRRWTVAPGLAAGLVTGYQHTPEQTGAVAPWGMVTLTIGLNDRWRMNLGYIPSRLFLSDSIDVATLQFSVRL